MKTLTLAILLLVCLAPAARAQHPIFIINGVRLDKCENALTTTGANPLSLAGLDANAIENIEVIKGAAAASLYGPDGANGVITVTMKKGATVSPTLCSTPRNPPPPCPVYIVDGKEVGSAACESSSPPKPAIDPIARYLYAPELVMAHQEAIGLNDRQRTGIQGIVKDMQSQVVDVQLRLASSSEKLTRLLSANAVDEAAVLQQVDQVLASEREVKRAQISLLVRVKNQLTPAQQAMIDRMR
jgi:TonB-dependent SusC/RagA subfamily outer membrane receptor